jgi:hypothetical protein
MVKRRGLADMLRAEAQHLQQTPGDTESVRMEETDSVSPGETESQSLSVDGVQGSTLGFTDHPAEPESMTLQNTDSVSNVQTDSVTLPKYQRLVRKEARLHEAQYDELTRLARDLNRRKQEVGEIITANTLLRVATELLLRRRSELRGDTEEELLSSLR